MDILTERTRPPGWSPPTPHDRYDLLVIGGGSAGLVAAYGARLFGARVALVERHRLGGDCLHTGCVPSKALLRAARAAAEARRLDDFGLSGEVRVDFPAVMARLRAVQAEVAAHDSAAALAAQGVHVFFGDGHFVSPDAFRVGSVTLRFRRACLATGSSPALPDLAGVDAALTTDTVWRLETLPRRLAVIGGGPVGCELAQAFARLGAEVQLYQRAPRLLPRDDAEAAEHVRAALVADGVVVHLGARVTSLRDGVRLGDDPPRRADAILVATGRRPHVGDLGLDAAGVEHGPEGVRVDRHLRTTARRIYAAGDVAAGQPRFTHAADAHARLVLANALFCGRRRVDRLLVPHCTYTDPEVAQVGLTADQAAARGPEVETLTRPLRTNDRAVLDGASVGFARVHLAAGTQRILGATLVGAHAGEMIAEVTLAMRGGRGLSALRRTIHPYPTQAGVLARLGDDAYARSWHPWLKRALRGWLAFTRRLG